MAGAYTFGRDVYAEAMEQLRDREDRSGPVGVGPSVGASTLRGRTEEGAFGASRLGTATGTRDIPWAWIAGIGLVAVLLATRRA